MPCGLVSSLRTTDFRMMIRRRTVPADLSAHRSSRKAASWGQIVRPSTDHRKRWLRHQRWEDRRACGQNAGRPVT